MKNFLASVLLLAMAVAFMGAKSALDARVEALEKIVKQSSVHLKSPDGKNKVTISAENNVVGIWLAQDGMKKLVAIYSTDNESCIGMYPHGKADSGGSIAMGIGLNPNGKPFIQYLDGEKYHNVHPKDF